jgi:hypothetical protein
MAERTFMPDFQPQNDSSAKSPGAQEMSFSTE